jgi:hypothetical protein
MLTVLVVAKQVLDALAALIGFAAVVLALLAALSDSDAPNMALTVVRLLFCRGRRAAGEITGVTFPITPDDLDAACLTEMLRHGKHLPDGVSVTSVLNHNAEIRDGVKGDKAIISVEYSQKTELPSRFFVKFNLRGVSGMRFLCETSEVCRCEALFYHHLAPKVAAGAAGVPSPKAYFVDFNKVTGEFVLLSELVEYGGGERGLLPVKHRVRDAHTLEEQVPSNDTRYTHRIVLLFIPLICAEFGLNYPPACLNSAFSSGAAPA